MSHSTKSNENIKITIMTTLKEFGLDKIKYIINKPDHKITYIVNLNSKGKFAFLNLNYSKGIIENDYIFRNKNYFQKLNLRYIKICTKLTTLKELIQILVNEKINDPLLISNTIDILVISRGERACCKFKNDYPEEGEINKILGQIPEELYFLNSKIYLKHELENVFEYELKYYNIDFEKDSTIFKIGSKKIHMLNPIFDKLLNLRNWETIMFPIELREKIKDKSTINFMKLLDLGKNKENKKNNTKRLLIWNVDYLVTN